MESIKDLTSFMNETDLFQPLSETEMTDFYSELEIITLPRDTIIVEQGEPGEAIYFIYDGTVDVYLDQEQAIKLEQLGKGSYFGEIGLLVNMPRTATVKAGTSVTVLKLTRPGFMRLFDKHPAIMQNVFQVLKQRLEGVQLARLLNNYFQLDTDTFQHLQTELSRQHLAIGDCLCREGDDADAMYLIVNGCLRAYVRQDSGEQQYVAEMRQGQAVGEFALLIDEKRSATVYAVRDSDVIRISKNVFTRLLIEHPEIILPLTKAVIAQQLSHNKRSKHIKHMNLAVIPIHRDLPVQEFTMQLIKELSCYGKTLHLNSEQIERQIGYRDAARISHEHPLYPAISAWLSDQENTHQFIVYQAQAENTSWTQRCIRSADHILLVADATLAPEIREVERLIQQIHSNVTIDLALIQPADIMYPTGTRKWLEPRDVGAHYHVQLGNALLFRRMARRLTDNAVGLVLSGGGARGFAHVGAFRAIDEANLEIDVIGCSSMGALLGALFATGHDSDDISAIAIKHKFPKGLMDYTFPHTALIKSQALTEWLQDTYAGIDVEDLWRPYFSVSANLTQARQVVHTQGPLWEAVRASMAIPAVFSPLCRRGEILVDGGIMNNLPIDIMRDFCANGQIIALNASPAKEPDTDFDFAPSLSGWKILWGKLNIFSQAIKVPSLAEIILRTMEVNSASKAKQSEQEADVFIQMATQKFGLLDFAVFHEIIECGYESSKPQIDALKQQMDRLDSIEP